MASMEKIKNKRDIIFYSLIVLIFLAGGFLRLWQLSDVPPGVWYDEAFNGLDAIEAQVKDDYKIFYVENYGREGLYINILGLSFRTLGVDSFALRFPSALFGFLTLIGFFFLAKELKFSRVSVLLGTFMIAFSFWHINFSRIAFRGIMVPMLLVWSFYFFFKAINCRHSQKTCSSWAEPTFFAIAGILTGLGLHTYIAYRVVPIIFFILVVLCVIVTRDFFKKYWKGAMIFTVAAFVIALPLFVYFYQHTDQFVGRTNAVSIFNNPEMGFFQSLGKSITFHLGSFFFAGDPNQRHNHSAFSLIPIAWSVVFALGFILSLKEIFVTLFAKLKISPRIKSLKKTKAKSARFFHAAVLAQAIFWAMLIPGVMSIEGIPHALRIIGVIPAIFLISMFSFEYLAKIYSSLKHSRRRQFKPWRWNILRFSFYGLIVVVLLAGVSQAYLYFEVWAKSPETEKSFEKDQYDLGKLVSELPLEKKNYLIVTSESSISQDRKDFGSKTAQFTGYPKIKSYLFYKPFEGLATVPCNDTQIVFQTSDDWLREQFQEKCPNLKLQKITPLGGTYGYWVLR